MNVEAALHHIECGEAGTTEAEVLRRHIAMLSVGQQARGQRAHIDGQLMVMVTLMAKVRDLVATPGSMPLDQYKAQMRNALVGFIRVAEYIAGREGVSLDEPSGTY
jgi:hypothetical protein